MSESTPQEKLAAAGFIDVTGRMESRIKRIPLAPPGQRNRWHSNKGVFCFIDGNGHSWIAPAKAFFGKMPGSSDFLADYSNDDCYVPFSNDGGHFVREVWYWIY